MGMQRNQNSQRILKKKNPVGGLIVANFKTYRKATVIKTAYVVLGYGETSNQWNRTESLRNPHICSPLIFNSGPRPFNRWCWSNWISTSKRIKMGPYLTPFIEIHTKWIEDLKVKAKTIPLE